MSPINLPCTTSRPVPGLIPGGVTGFFSDIFHGPGVDSATSENEYQEHFLVVKAAGAWGWQPHKLHVPNVMKSGRLNLLEPSEPHQACYGTPLPLPIKLDRVSWNCMWDTLISLFPFLNNVNKVQTVWFVILCSMLQSTFFPILQMTQYQTVISLQVQR